MKMYQPTAKGGNSNTNEAKSASRLVESLARRHEALGSIPSLTESRRGRWLLPQHSGDQERGSEFRVILGYAVSSKPAWST